MLNVKYREDITPLLNEKELLYSIIKSVERINVRKESEEKLGPTFYSVTAYANVKRVTIPVNGGGVVFASFEGHKKKGISGLIICYFSDNCCCCSVAHCVQLFATPWTVAHQGSLSLTISCWNLPSSCPMHWWCHPAISSSDVLFSSYSQSFPASGIFPMSHLFVSDDQNTGTSALALVLPMSIQGGFPLRCPGFVSLLSKGYSGVFSSTSLKASILWHSAFFMVQLLQSYVTTGKTIVLTIQPLSAE